MIHSGEKHRWSGFHHLADLTGYLGPDEQNLDWDHVLSQAYEYGAAAVAFAGWLMFTGLTGVAAPRALEPGAPAFHASVSTAALAVGRIFRRDGGLPGYHEWACYSDLLSNGRSPRGRFAYFRSLLSPEFNDREFIAASQRTSRPVQTAARIARLLKNKRLSLLKRLR